MTAAICAGLLCSVFSGCIHWLTLGMDERNLNFSKIVFSDNGLDFLEAAIFGRIPVTLLDRFITTFAGFGVYKPYTRIINSIHGERQISAYKILLFLNSKEMRKKDSIIYNSKQFLQHSIDVQESERKRISYELHDTVAQNMRYGSLLAEKLSEKEAAGKIITVQNQNIQDIRNLCYNLTPPHINAQQMIPTG